MCRKVFDRILPHADAGNPACANEVVCAAEATALVRDGASHTEIRKWLKHLAQNVSIFGRAKTLRPRKRPVPESMLK